MSKGINSKNCIKEFSENELLSGVSWYDFGWRQLDVQLGVWHCLDPVVEKYYSLSPYNYVFNNPINVVDPDGRAPMIDNWLRSIYYHQDSGPGMRGGGSYTPGWDLNEGGGVARDKDGNIIADFNVGKTKYGVADAEGYWVTTLYEYTVTSKSTGKNEVTTYLGFETTFIAFAQVSQDPNEQKNGDDSYQGIIPPPDGWEEYNRSDWEELKQHLERFDRKFDGNTPKAMVFIANTNPIFSTLNYLNMSLTGKDFAGNNSSIAQRFIAAPFFILITIIPGAKEFLLMDDGVQILLPPIVDEATK